MQHLFWLIPGEICGRPGPNHQPWQARQLKAAGVGAVLSVNQAESVYPDDFEAIGVSCECIPLASNAPPRPGDLELCCARLPLAYAWVRGEIEGGKPAMVHCRQGKDRTGLFLAYYLMRRDNLDVKAAIARVMAARPIALSASGWERFAREVLDACRDDTRRV
jgi:protein-tyrosine phosphatase